jgi:hypothetical protein
MIPRLLITIAQEDELRVELQADSDQDRDALILWLASRRDFTWFVDVLRAMYAASADGREG